MRRSTDHHQISGIELIIIIIINRHSAVVGCRFCLQWIYGIFGALRPRPYDMRTNSGAQTMSPLIERLLSISMRACCVFAIYWPPINGMRCTPAPICARSASVHSIRNAFNRILRLLRWLIDFFGYAIVYRQFCHFFPLRSDGRKTRFIDSIHLFGVWIEFNGMIKLCWKEWICRLGVDAEMWLEHILVYWVISDYSVLLWLRWFNRCNRNSKQSSMSFFTFCVMNWNVNSLCVLNLGDNVLDLYLNLASNGNDRTIRWTTCRSNVAAHAPITGSHSMYMIFIFYNLYIRR